MLDGRRHVLVHQPLQVGGEAVTIGANDDIGTHAAVAGDVAAGIGKGDICGIIGEGDADLGLGSGDELCRPGIVDEPACYGLSLRGCSDPQQQAIAPVKA